MQKKHYACFTDISYYASASKEVKEFFGKAYVTPTFKRKRGLYEFINELSTNGVLSYYYTEYVITKKDNRPIYVKG